MLPYILGHAPGGISSRTAYHFAQEIKSGKFRKYDYNDHVNVFGSNANLEAYGSIHPPEYSIKKVNVPVALMWSDNDWLADPKVPH